MGQDLSMLVGSLREPKSLQEALRIYHAKKRSCIGLSFPYAADCPQSIPITDKEHEFALHDLKLSILGVKGYSYGLIHKLKSLAHELSCPTHRRDPDHALQFAYYWIASEHLPNSFTDMGFFLELPFELSLDVTRDAESDEGCSYNEWLVRMKNIVEALDSGTSPIVHRAVQQLERGWLKQWEDVNRISLFRNMLEHRLEVMSQDEDGRIEMRKNEMRWNAWHWEFPIRAFAEGSSETTDSSDDDSLSDIDDFYTNNHDGAEQSSESEGHEQISDSEGESHEKVEVVETTQSMDNATLIMGEQSPRPGLSPLQPESPQGLPSTPEPLLSSSRSTRSASRVSQLPNTRKDCGINQGRSFSAPQTSRSRDNRPKNKISPKSRASRYNVLGEHVADDQSHTQGELVSSTGHNAGVKPTSLPYSYLEHNDRTPAHDTDTHDINLDMNTELPNNRASNPYFPNFQPIKLNQRSIRVVTDHVFKEMKKPLADKKDLEKGHVYTLRLVGRPGFVKIGHTKNTIEHRTEQIQRCFTYELEPIADDDRCEIQYRSKVERLVHTELMKYRRTFPCNCPQKTRGRKQGCDSSDSLTTHSEWFEIEEAKACEVVKRWRDWMRTDPYCNTNLRPTEEARIEHYAPNAELMAAMTVQVEKDKNIREGGRHVANEVLEDTDTWRWDEFMAFPRWKLHMLLLYKELFEARVSRSTCSRWDSLCKYWQSNVLLIATFSLIPFMLFRISRLLPFASASGLVLVLANSVMLGVCAVLYAA
ncbi:hypothetical protein N7G274_010769 [Stereocaulon virgatum]|uniref:Bacteriophage T5 Orf172 DNA-binding domain-containing protein n=1 Tax=Stereocaulon virgatum TaxID=373712 RepID=A0ABR3ZZK9_9LECA